MTPTDKNLCGNDAGLLLFLPTKLDGMGIPVFFRNHENEISKLVTTNRSTRIINSAAKKNIQNSKRNCK